MRDEFLLDVFSNRVVQFQAFLNVVFTVDAFAVSGCLRRVEEVEK
jgi:hypothetical protein